MRLVHFKVIPENVGIRRFQFPLEERSHRIIHGIPKAQKKISPLPNPWYIVNEIQAAKFVAKLINEKEKPTRAETR
jgi:hypothetical protein